MSENPLTDATLPGEAPHDATLRRVERIISGLLRSGVVTSLVLMLAGTLISFFRSHRYGESHDDLVRLIGKEGDFPHSLAWLLEGLGSLRGQSLIVLGLVILIVTPVLRVMVTIVAYLIERDRIFVLLSSIVLALLILSMVLGNYSG